LSHGETGSSIEQWRNGALYVAFFYDADLNEIMGKDELVKVKITFKRR
jgi:hypothetical protein